MHGAWQGVSERNISCVVEQRQGAKALRAVHASFLLSQLVSQTTAPAIMIPTHHFLSRWRRTRDLLYYAIAIAILGNWLSRKF